MQICTLFDKYQILDSVAFVVDLFFGSISLNVPDSKKGTHLILFLIIFD